MLVRSIGNNNNNRNVNFGVKVPVKNAYALLLGQPIDEMDEIKNVVDAMVGSHVSTLEFNRFWEIANECHQFLKKRLTQISESVEIGKAFFNTNEANHPDAGKALLEQEMPKIKRALGISGNEVDVPQLDEQTRRKLAVEVLQHRF